MASADQQAAEPGHEHGPHLAPPLEDPGKRERVASGVPVVPAYDGYRAWAVMAVVLFHILGASGLLSRGADSLPAQLVYGTLPYAIPVFFIVSGFVMFLPAAARGGRFGSVTTFAIRRSARLFPALWACLLVMLAVLAVVPNSPLPMPGLGEVALNFSGQAQWATLFDPLQQAGFNLNTPLYTLTIELAFYLVLPFVAAWYFRHPWLGLAIAAVIAVAWREGFANIIDLASLVGIELSEGRALELQFTNNQFPLWTFSFGAGMTSAWAYVRLRESQGRAELERAAPMVALASLVVVGICAFVAGRYAIGNPSSIVVHEAWQSSLLTLVYTGSLATAMLALAFCGERLQLPLSHPRVRLLADVSYGVYLIHMVVIWLLLNWLQLSADGSLSSFAIMLAVVVSISIAYGYASTRYVEQPIRRWSRHLGRRRREPGASEPEGSPEAAPAREGVAEPAAEREGSPKPARAGTSSGPG